MCHATATRGNLKRLASFLEEGDRIIQAGLESLINIRLPPLITSPVSYQYVYIYIDVGGNVYCYGGWGRLVVVGAGDWGFRHRFRGSGLRAYEALNMKMPQP